MKDDTTLSVQNVSKQYRLGEVGTGTLSHDFNRWWHKIRGKEDPYSIIGDTNDRSTIGDSEYVWALKDINFEVKKGEILGIIGKNGAGKSTLLKILSKVTGPTIGNIKMKGRVATLLEVGTGFHPELTGRENIYLNGAILGMTKAEVKSKLEEIVNFSGCAKYVDTPVKRYSSGMMVRLGFAVAAHLEPEILIVDEVLAVGDAEFQKKAIGKMKDISEGGGRTVLFVSHNMSSIQNLCTRGIVLENGLLKFDGSTEESIEYYLQNKESLECARQWEEAKAPGNEHIKLLNMKIENASGLEAFYIDSQLTISYQLLNKSEGSTLGTTIRIRDSKEQIIFSDGQFISPDKNSKIGIYSIKATIPSKLLTSGKYSIDLIVGENRRYIIVNEEGLLGFEILFGGEINKVNKPPGLIYQELNWEMSHSE
jgi:lipopolysaccharide transport system ATP-binding protein